MPIEMFEKLSNIVCRGQSLTERLGVIQAQTDPALFPAETSDLTGWQAAVADGDPARFDQRLAALGLNRHQANLLFTAPPSAQSDAWLKTLEAILAEAASLQNVDWQDRVFNGEEPQPFEELFLPFIRYARRTLGERVAGEVVTGQALARLEYHLLERLARLSQKALGLEFGLFRAKRSFGLFLATIGAENSDDNTLPGRELYTAFIREMLANRLAGFMEQYAALAHLLAVVCNQWVDSTAEFINRVAADLPLIGRKWSAQPERVVSIRPGLSDPHRQGRSVMQVSFDCGLKLVYKPRNLAVETAFQNLLEWCNRQTLPLDLKVLKVLDCQDYGWVEYAEAHPTSTAGETENYYYRVGMLIGLLYLLRGADYHYQNLLGCGEYPVPVDQEGLIYPQMQSITTDPAFLVNREFNQTVLHIGLLPAWGGKSREEISDISGLGGAAEAGSKGRIRWLHINTDRMVLKYVPLPKGGSDPTSAAAEHVKAIVAGFTAIYRCLLEKRSGLLSQDCQIIAAFNGVQTRFVYRNTEIYASLLTGSLEPEYLKSGMARGIYLDRLSRPMHLNKIPAALLEAERSALETGNIPILAAFSDSRHLFLEDSGEMVENFFSEAPYQKMVEQFNRWSEADLARQLGYIKASFYAANPASPKNNTAQEVYEPVLLSSQELLDEAIKLGLALEEQALTGEKGAVWIYLSNDRRLDRFRLNPLDFSFYSGSGGVALFLAALAAQSGEKRFARLARAAWEVRLAFFRQPGFSHRLWQQMGPGGGVGAGSLVYSLTRCGQFLNDPELIETAGKLLEFDPALIEQDQAYDLIFGSAGAIMGALAYYAVSKERSALEIAKSFGEHLLAAARPDENGLTGWPTLEGRFATGFSHGAAGLALAFLRLYAASGERRYQEAAETAIKFENSRFSPDEGNWHYYRSTPEKPLFWNTWCHGATGIGMARLYGLPWLDSPAIRQDIRRALDATLQSEFGTIDHICCGNAGRVEFLLSAYQVLHDPDLGEQARLRMGQIISRASANGSFAILPGAPAGLCSPGFFQGTGGIGYSLLRMANPTGLPAVSVWE